MWFGFRNRTSERTIKESGSWFYGWTGDIINNLINKLKIIKIKNNLSYYLSTILNEFSYFILSING